MNDVMMFDELTQHAFNVNQEYLDHVSKRMNDILEEKMETQVIVTLDEVMDELGEDNIWAQALGGIINRDQAKRYGWIRRVQND